IQILLGHVNINTTGIYAQVSSKTMRAVTSPLDQIVAVMEGRAPPG
ncbi:integrase, partial [Novosphingobium flavum]|nr:integrase [Novosphingobium aerophilum]